MNTASNWHWQFEAIGTVWVIDVYNPLLSLKEDEVLTKVRQRIDIFDKNYSRFRSDSLVSQMSRHPGDYALPADGEKLFDLYQRLYVFTGGAFTPLIGSTLEQAGYDASYSLVSKAVSPTPAWEESLDYNYPHLTIKKPITIDVGAGGKGYLMDLVGEILEDASLTDYCLDAGQDLLYKKADGVPLEVGLEDPDNTGKVIGVAKIVNQSICGSSGNRRKWEGFHHIIDPRTLSSPEEISAVWVVANDALLADALSTCLFFVSPTDLESNFVFEWLIIHKDRTMTKSEKFPAQVFTK